MGPVREYFYFLNERGLLYHLIDPEPFIKRSRVPSGPAFLSNTKFLNFFFQRLRRAPLSSPHDPRFSFVSLCGDEVNYMACEDAPIVFTGLHINQNISTAALRFAGDLTQPFDHKSLGQSGGRLYHPVTVLSHRLHSARQTNEVKPTPFVSPAGVLYGLLESHVTMELGFSCMDETAEGGTYTIAPPSSNGGGGGEPTIVPNLPIHNGGYFPVVK